ncbi:MAG: hypothetical protein IPJ39_18550 [Saprospiraceae bacterium]|nr:hypothetical protein [Saprospiraceae bacterium]
MMFNLKFLLVTKLRKFKLVAIMMWIDIQSDGFVRNITLISGEVSTNVDAGFTILSNAFIGDFMGRYQWQWYSRYQ